MENNNEKEQNVTTENTVATEPAAPVSDTALLTEIRDLQKQQLFWRRISSCCIAVMAAAVLISALVIVPKAVRAVHNVNEVAVKAQSSLDDMDGMVSNITEATGKLNTLVDENGESLTTAVKNLSEIDFEGLNKAIKDLQDAVGPMAQFMNKFH